MVTIRDMNRDEAEAVLGLWRRHCREAFGGRDLTDDEAASTLTTLTRIPESDQAFCLVAQDGGELVGFAMGHVMGHPVMRGLAGELEDAYVVPEARRRGIGRVLVGRAVAWLRSHGAGTIRVHICADNTATQEAFRRMGWENDFATFSLYPTE